MSVSSESVPESASPAFERHLGDVTPPEALSLDEQAAFDLHREINARRAQIENPELLRRIRSL